MYRFVITTAIWLVSLGMSYTQSLSIEGGNVFENGQICLDVSVDGFQDLIGMEFELRWDSMVLEFESVTARTGLPGFSDVQISDPTETSQSTPSNIVVVSWFDNDLTPRSLPDGDVIFEICYNAIGMTGSSSTMNLYNLNFTDPDLNPVDFDDVDNIVSITTAVGESLAFNFPTTNADSGQVICVPLTVANFDTISQFSFGVKWDATVLSFQNVITSLALEGFNSSNISVVGADSITVNWTDIDGTGETLSNGAELFELCLRVVGAPARSSLLQIGNLSANQPTGPITDLQATNGLIIVNAPPEAEDLRIMASDVEVNPGDNFCVPVRVSGFKELEGVDFTISWDNTVVSYTRVQNLASLDGFDMGDISTIGVDPTGLSMSWDSPDGDGRDLGFNIILFEVCFSTIGATGSMSNFDFSNMEATHMDALPVTEIGDNAVISVVTPTAPDVIFSLDTITLMDGETGCLTMTVEDFNAVDVFEFEINWNTLNIDFQSADILANVPGLDDTDMTTPANGGSDGQLILSWSDANGVGRSLNDGTALMELCFEASGSNVSRTLTVDNIQVESSTGLQVSGVGRNGRITIPSNGIEGELTLTAENLSLDLNDSGCFPVRVSGFEDLITMEFRLSWDNSVFEYTGVQNLASLPYFSTGSISNPFDGQLNIVWIDDDVTGKSLADNTVLFEVCGTGKAVGSTASTFTDDEASDTNSTVTVNKNNGQISVQDGGSGNGDLVLTAGDLNLNLNDAGCFPVTVEGFQDMITMEFRISWDNSIFEYTGIQNLSSLAYFSTGSISNPFDGQLNVVWIDDDVTGKSLANNAVLFEVCGTGKTAGTTGAIFTEMEASNTSQVVTVGNDNGLIVVDGGGSGTDDLEIIVGDETVMPNGNVCVPVTVRQFTDMLGMTFSLEWDDTVIDFDEVVLANNLVYLTMGGISTPPDIPQNNMIFVNWIDDELTGKDLADNTELFSVCYDAVGNNGDRTDIVIGDTEFIDETQMEIPAVLTNGSVEITNNSAPTFEMITTSGNTVDMGSVVCLPVSVRGFEEITELEALISWDASIFQFESVDNIFGLQGLDISDFLTPSGGGTPGNLALNWTDGDNSGETISDDQVLFELCLEAIGDEGEMSDVNISGLMVENANSSVINIQNTNGDITINTTGSPSDFKLIGEVVSGARNTQVCATISVEGFTNISEFTFKVEWDDAIVDFVSVNSLTTLNGFDEDNILDPIEQPTLGSSVLVDWDHPGGGSSTLAGTADLFEICFDLIGDFGTISSLNITSILASDDSGANIVTSKEDGYVGIDPDQDNGDVTIIAPMDSGNQGDELCVDITVRNFDNILSSEFSLLWDPNILELDRVTNLVNLPDFNQARISTPSENMIPGLLGVSWFDENFGTHDLNDDAVFFTLCFNLIGPVGSGTALNFKDVEFSESGTAIPYRSIDGYIAIEGVVAPTISFDISDENVNPGDEVCVAVTAEGFDNIDALDLDFGWNSSILSFSRVTNIAAIPGLDQSDFTSSGNQLDLDWTNSSGTGITLAGGATLFEICFDAIGTAGSSSAVGLTSGTVVNGDGTNLIISIDNGSVTLNDVLSINEIEVDSVSCFGGMDGTITLSVTGGSGTYNYTWDPPLSTGPGLINLPAGEYDVTIDDGSGNMVMETVEVFEPNELISSPNVTAANPPMSDGEIDLNISGGTAPYDINWCCGLQNDLEIQTGLDADVYSATITDANGCEISTGDIDLGSGLFVREETRREPTCHDSSNGSLTIAISGGTPNYQITWSDGMNVIGNTEQIDGLTVGTYFYTVTDSGSPQLMTTGSLELMGNPEITIDFDISPETNAGGDGSIEIDVMGGVPNYFFSWFNYQNNGTSSLEDQFNLTSGYYRLDVIDAAGCRVTIDSVFVGGALFVPTAGIVVDSVSCPGECDGVITLFPEGGTGDYEYCFDGGASTASNTQGGFCGGDNIVVIVKDVNNGDQTVVQVSFEDPEPLDVQYNSMGVSMGNDGGIVLDVSGGKSPYTYEWSNGEETKDIFDLAAGTYSVTITDANDCETIVNDIPVDIRTLAIEVERVVDVVCAGDANGSIEVGVTGGCPPYNYVWRRNGVVVSNDEDLFNITDGEYELEVVDQCNELLFSGPIVIDASSDLTISLEIISDYNGFAVSGFGLADGTARVITNDGVEPYNIMWSNGSTNSFISDLTAGTYSVTVEDDLGCVKTGSITLEQPTRLRLDFEVVNVNDCANENNGVARAIVSGGISPYQYDWSNSSDNGSTASGLPSGFTVVTITDQNNVQIIDSVFISSLTEFDIDTIIDPDRGNGEGAITLLVNGGAGPYTYQWSDPNNSTTSSINGLFAGNYTVVVTDFNGCSELLVITVPRDGNAPGCLESMEIFTPNGDGKNEFFVINCVENYINDIEIYDRWGKLIFEQENYNNRWDGRDMGGELLPQGAYFFVLNVINSSGQREAIRGHISLIR